VSSRRRATIARNGITQILETAAEYGFAGEEWPISRRETRELSGRRVATGWDSTDARLGRPFPQLVQLIPWTLLPRFWDSDDATRVFPWTLLTKLIASN
jgi:hypothetical protein